MPAVRFCLVFLSGCLLIAAHATAETRMRVRKEGEPEKHPKSIVVSPSPYTAITIAEVRYKAFPYSYTLSYRFMPTEEYLRKKSCSLWAAKDEKTKRLFGCSTTDMDTKVIPVLSCNNRYNKTSRPTYMSKDDLLLSLSKALEWAGVNKSAKLKFNKGLPPSGKLNFAGIESGRSLIFSEGCPITIIQIQKFIDTIKDNYAAAYSKSVSTNVDELFK